jgi:hypothetical protein
MADNAPYTPGAGRTMRTRDKSGIDIQVVAAGAHKRTYKGQQNLVLSGTSQALTVPAGAEFADIYGEGATANDVARYWHTGGGGADPTATVGKKLKDHEEISTADPATFEAINSTGTTTLRIEYYAYE